MVLRVLKTSMGFNTQQSPHHMGWDATGAGSMPDSPSLRRRRRSGAWSSWSARRRLSGCWRRKTQSSKVARPPGWPPPARSPARRLRRLSAETISTRKPLTQVGPGPTLELPFYLRNERQWVHPLD